MVGDTNSYLHSIPSPVRASSRRTPRQQPFQRHSPLKRQVRPGSGDVRVDAGNGGGDMSETIHDILDDDYWKDQYYRAPKLLDLRRIEDLAKRLQAEAWAEYEARQAAEPISLKEQREQRSRRLQELVIKAIEGEDDELWQQVDAMVFGRGGTEEHRSEDE
jgi:hypothetical protein